MSSKLYETYRIGNLLNDVCIWGLFRFSMKRTMNYERELLTDFSSELFLGSFACYIFLVLKSVKTHWLSLHIL